MMERAKDKGKDMANTAADKVCMGGVVLCFMCLASRLVSANTAVDQGGWDGSCFVGSCVSSHVGTGTCAEWARPLQPPPDVCTHAVPRHCCCLRHCIRFCCNQICCHATHCCRRRMPSKRCGLKTTHRLCGTGGRKALSTCWHACARRDPPAPDCLRAAAPAGACAAQQE